MQRRVFRSTRPPCPPRFSKLRTNWNWSLTGRDGPHFAPASQTGLVSRVHVAVVVGGGLQVSHHRAGVGAGEIERSSGGLGAHQQVVALRRRYLSPLYKDRGARQRQADFYLRCVGDWEERAGVRKDRLGCHIAALRPCVMARLARKDAVWMGYNFIQVILILCMSCCSMSILLAKYKYIYVIWPLKADFMIMLPKPK